MTTATQDFYSVRSRLHGIAYRMLGSVAEAEDLVQDIWLRWNASAGDTIDNPEAWLVSATTRLSIDRLRSAKVARLAYTGIWLPEPQLDQGPATPEQTHELADDVSVAFLVLLERLEPQARAAFLMREVFDADYSEVAEMLGKSEVACRQIVSRARAAIQAGAGRPVPAPALQAALMRRFAEALSHGDFAGIQALLADDAQLLADGGGKVKSFLEPLSGGRRIAQLFYATRLRHKDAMRIAPVRLNGRPALLRFIGGVLESAQAYETDGQRIVLIHVQRNPDKLARIAAAFAGGEP
jgi:RNA polymerase sigma-70 factor (TIGR02957 family)